MLVAVNMERVAVIAISLLLFLLFKGQQYWPSILAMCLRLKWLWLSLIILYGWFVPGSPVYLSDTIPLSLIPSYEGLMTGILRTSALLTVVCAVVIVIQSTQKEALIVSIMWLIKPLQLFKINTVAFSARLVLTLDKVTGTEKEIKESIAMKHNNLSLFQCGIDVIAQHLLNIEEQAKQSSVSIVMLPIIEKPKIIQWLIPLLLFITLYMI